MELIETKKREQINCECLIYDFIHDHPTDNLKLRFGEFLTDYEPEKEVKEHIYYHVLIEYLSRNCCKIVSCYVGNLKVSNILYKNYFDLHCKECGFALVCVSHCDVCAAINTQQKDYVHKYIEELGENPLLSEYYDEKISYTHTQLCGYGMDSIITMIFYDFDNLSFWTIQSNGLLKELFMIVIDYLKPINERVAYDEISLSCRFNIHYNNYSLYKRRIKKITEFEKNITGTHKKYWFLKNHDNTNELIDKKELEHIIKLFKKSEVNDHKKRHEMEYDYMMKIVGVRIVQYQDDDDDDNKKELHVKCIEYNRVIIAVYTYCQLSYRGKLSKYRYKTSYYNMNKIPDHYKTPDYIKWCRTKSKIMREKFDRIYPILT
jgi:hypothetical protein